MRIKAGILDYIPGDKYFIKFGINMMDIHNKVKVKRLERGDEVFLLGVYNKFSSIILHNGDRGYVTNFSLIDKITEHKDISGLIDDDREPKEPRTSSAGRG